MPISKEHLLQYAVTKAKGNSPATADLWGGGTAPTLGAGTVFRFDEFTPSSTPEFYEDQSQTGDMSKRASVVSAVLPSLSATSKIYPNCIGSLLFAAFGYSDLGGPRTAGSLKQHIFELRMRGKDQEAYTSAESTLATGNAGLSPAYNAADRVNACLVGLMRTEAYDEKYINWAINDFTISGSSKEPLKIQISGPVERVTQDTNRTESANITDTCDGKVLYTRHCTAKFGQYVAPVGNADAVLSTVDIFDFSIKTTMGMADSNITTGTSNSGLSRSEPVASGDLSVEIDLTVNKHQDASYKQLEQAGTICSLLISATNGTEKLALCVPECQIISAVPEFSDGSRWKLKLKATKPASTDPFPATRSPVSTPTALVHAPLFYAVLNTSATTNYMRAS